jgi:FGGY-family pentulose kinase
VTNRFYLGIDVGTGSARAGVFDDTGKMHGMGIEPIQMFRPAEHYAEHSSEDIWRACGVATRRALAQAGTTGARIVGIGFDATCSLVVLGEGDAPVTVSPTGRDAQNVIVWMDHRATAEARRINATAHDVLRYVGGVVSPEMQTPKLLWLKENLPETWARARRFFDLPDYLTYRATGDETRSLCTTVCKWTYLGHASGWDTSFFRGVGLDDLANEGFARIGTRVRPMGERVAGITAKAAEELGLAAGTPVGVAIIDAHAGGLGLLGASIDGIPATADVLNERLALISGTSSCHMAVSKEPRFIPGIWGPYHSAMVPGLWLTEGGQSATGALIDHMIDELAREALARGTRASTLLNERLEQLAHDAPFPAALTRDLHVLPDHHGNRSPRADATLRGMVSGLTLSDSVDALAIVYVATVQSLAHGTRHIVDRMNAHGYRITTLVATGGDTKNEVFLREHADITGCRIVLPRESEAVLLGAAMLGAVAAKDRASVLEAMSAMSAVASIREPCGGDVRAFHDAKHKVFLRMHEDQLAYRALMATNGTEVGTR